MNTLDEVLSSKTRAEIFRLLFDGENHEYYLRDIERRTHLAVRSIQQELPKLLQLDLVLSRKDGNRVYFKANTQHPIYNDIKNLVIKTSDWVNKLKKNLSRSGVEIAFMFGSMATQTDKATSDVDLCVIGEIPLREVSGLVKPIGRTIEREINAHHYTAKQWKNRIEKNDHFVTSIMESKKIFLIGTENELKAMGR